MKHTNILKDFLRYVSLNILGQMAYSCYTMADTFFVSAKLGSVGLTALNLAFPIFCLMNGIGMMIGIGAGTRYSLAKSRGEKELGNKIFTNAFYMVVAFASLFFLAGILFSGTLVRLLGADDSMFALTNTYLQVMLLFAPAFFLNNLLQCFVRNDGCPGLSMAAMISGSLSNVILDYVFFSAGYGDSWFHPCHRTGSGHQPSGFVPLFFQEKKQLPSQKSGTGQTKHPGYQRQRSPALCYGSGLWCRHVFI